MSPWMVRVRSTAHFFVFIIGVSPTAFNRTSIFFLVSPAGSSVPGETAAEEGGSGVAVSGETSVGPSPSAAVEGGSCSADSDSSAILLSRRRGRKWWLSVFRGGVYGRGRHWRGSGVVAGGTQPNGESWSCQLVLYVEHATEPWLLIPQLRFCTATILRKESANHVPAHLVVRRLLSD